MLKEICNSCFKHKSIDSSHIKKYFFIKDLNNDRGEKIICEECLNTWLKETSDVLANTILQFTTPSLKSYYLNECGDVSSKEISDTEFVAMIKSDTKNNYVQTISKYIDVNSYLEDLYPSSFSLTIDQYYYGEFPIYGTIGDVGIEDYIYSKVRVYSNEPLIFDFNLPILYQSQNCKDTYSVIFNKVYTNLANLINKRLTEIPENIVLQLMNYNAEYNSGDCGSISNKKCKMCQIPLTYEYYFYNNNLYCLDCMYAIVVNLAFDNKLTDYLDLSNPLSNNQSSIINLRNLPEWKRSVIDKYVNIMNSFGINTTICHFYMTSN